MNRFGSGKKGPTPNVKAVLKEVSQFIKWVPPIDAAAADIGEESFTLLLSGISTCRIMPGIPQHMDYDSMYRCDAENAVIARVHLYERYGISDGITLASVADEMFHAQEEYEQFESFWNGKPLFRLKELPLREQEYFVACRDFAERLRPFVSHRGFFAWDCNEKIGLFRKAYACGIIDEDRFWRLSIPLAERALTMYHDWKSYGISCRCGAAYYMVCAQNGQGDVLRFVEINRTLLEHMLDRGGVWSRNRWYRSTEDVDEIPDEELPELDMLYDGDEALQEPPQEEGARGSALPEEGATVSRIPVLAKAGEEPEARKEDRDTGGEKEPMPTRGDGPEEAPPESTERQEEEEEIDIGIVIAVEPGYDAHTPLSDGETPSPSEEGYDPLDPVFDRFAGEMPEDEDMP